MKEPAEGPELTGKAHGKLPISSWVFPASKQLLPHCILIGLIFKNIFRCKRNGADSTELHILPTHTHTHRVSLVVTFIRHV